MQTTSAVFINYLKIEIFSKLPFILINEKRNE